MWKTGDPLADYSRHEAEEERCLQRRPKCDICGEPIQDDYLYDINGTLICEKCLERDFRKDTENYES